MKQKLMKESDCFKTEDAGIVVGLRDRKKETKYKEEHSRLNKTLSRFEKAGITLNKE